MDDNIGIATKYDILSIPTLMVFQGGEVQKTLIGAQPRRRIEDELSAWIALAASPASTRQHGDPGDDQHRAGQLAAAEPFAEDEVRADRRPRRANCDAEHRRRWPRRRRAPMT